MTNSDRRQFGVLGVAALSATVWAACLVLVSVFHLLFGGPKPLWEILKPLLFMVGASYVIGFGGWGLQVLCDRLFGWQEGRTAFYLTAALAVFVVAYTLKDFF